MLIYTSGDWEMLVYGYMTAQREVQKIVLSRDCNYYVNYQFVYNYRGSNEFIVDIVNENVCKTENIIFTKIRLEVLIECIEYDLYLSSNVLNCKELQLESAYASDYTKINKYDGRTYYLSRNNRILIIKIGNEYHYCTGTSYSDIYVRKIVSSMNMPIRDGFLIANVDNTVSLEKYCGEKTDKHDIILDILEIAEDTSYIKKIKEHIQSIREVLEYLGTRAQPTLQ